MPATYAGVTLGLTDEALATWLESWHPIRDVRIFDTPTSPPGASAELSFNAPPAPPPLRPGVLYWPASASRYAISHWVVDSAALASIRQAAEFSSVPLDLVLDDGVNEPVTVPMWLLPARPLGQVLAAEANPVPAGLWLITLVDDRYRWWMRSADLEVELGTTTWSNLYDTIATALGVDIDYDTPASAYGEPSSAFTIPAAPLPLALDAIAYNVGQRICVQLDGTVEAIASDTALDRQSQEWALRRARIAGGLLALGEDAYGGGIDLARLLPETVRVTFRDQEGDPYPVDVDLEDLSLAPLPSGFGTFEGVRAWRSTGYAASGTPPSNLADLEALVEQMAADWARWQCGALDVTYAGCVSPTLSPLVDALEIGFILREPGDAARESGVYTRLYRAEWTDPVDSLGQRMADEPTFGFLTVEEVDGSPSYDDIHTLRVDQTDGFVVTNPATGVARLDLQAATTSQAGIVSTSAQTFGGVKGFNNSLWTKEYVGFGGAAGSGDEWYLQAVADNYIYLLATASAYGTTPGIYIYNTTTAGGHPSIVTSADDWFVGTGKIRAPHGFAVGDGVGLLSGGTATTGSLVFNGGLYISGTISVSLTTQVTGTLPIANGGTNATSAAAAATNLGVGTGDSPQFAAINLGHASDTTITRTGSGDIAIEGNAVYRAGGTDVALADGGTGASLADPNADRILFWDDSAGAVTWLTVGTGLAITDTTIAVGDLSGTYQPLDATLTALAGLNTTAGVVVQTGTDTFTKRTITGTANQITVSNGDGVSGNPTLSTPQDIATGSSPQFAGVNVGHASDTTITRASAGDIAVEGNTVYRAGGTDVALADGGTGASLTDPNADRILFWDDSAGAVTWLTAGSGLTITDTTITATGATEATQAEMETPTGSTQMVTPRRVNYHPGVCKGWVAYDGTADSVLASYGCVSSVSKTSTGIYVVNLSPSFSTGNYMAHATGGNGASGGVKITIGPAGSDPVASAFEVRVVSSTFAATDEDYLMVSFWGDQ